MSQRNTISEYPQLSINPQTLQESGCEDNGLPSYEATCLHTIYLTDPQKDREELLNAKGAITQGTCSWVLSTNEFTQWHQRGPASTDRLWVCGRPGSGKTMLSIFLSEYLESTASTNGTAESYPTTKDLVLYFHCSGSETTKNSETAILRGLLFQAIRQRPSLIDLVQQIYDTPRNGLLQNWSFDSLWAALRLSILNQYSQDSNDSEGEDRSSHQNSMSYIIVDGLDECEPASIRTLLRKLSRLGDEKELRGRAKVMITSREKPALRDALAENYVRLNLEEAPNAQAICADVREHIVQQIDGIARPDRKDYSTELSTSIKDCLAKNSHGNFLWVSMAIIELESTSRVEAWEHLSRLPPTLDALYEWMVMQIPPEWRELSTKVFLWVSLALRPLSVTELVVALDERRLGLRDPELVRRCVKRCGHILRTAADDTVHLIHHSAREYLCQRLQSSPSFFKDCVELNPFNLKEGHRLIASICIKNLINATQLRIQDLHIQQEGGRDLDSSTFIARTPTTLSGYAKAFWTDHVRNADELMLDIADSNPQIFEEHSLIRGILADEASKGLLTVDISVLHHATYYGFAALVGKLLKNGWRHKLRTRRLVGQRDGLGRTPLHLAVHRYDNGPIVELLLDRGADVSCKDHAGATAIDHAIKYGNVEIASFLAAYAQGE